MQVNKFYSTPDLELCQNTEVEIRVVRCVLYSGVYNYKVTKYGTSQVPPRFI
jgi:hypothetical protein